jgi:peptide/nickel transport system permease protein
MVRLLASRIAQALVVLVGVSLVVFVLVRVIPRDPVRLVVGDETTAEVVEAACGPVLPAI